MAKVKNARTVPFGPPTPGIHHAANVVDRVWRKHTGQQPRITGIQEEGHSEGSRHYGLPGDIRWRAFDVDADLDHILPPELLGRDPSWRASKAAAIRSRIESELKERLGSGEFDLVWEGVGTPGAHLHVEEDPKP